MKRMLIGIVIGAVLACSLGGVAGAIYAYAQATPKCPWTVQGTVTAQQGYPAAAARGYDSVSAIVDANCVLWLDVPDGANYVQFRFETTADADSTTIAILVCADDYLANIATYDAFGLGATVALTGGKQVGPHSNYYVDTAVVTNYLLSLTARDSGNDRIVIIEGDLKGFGKLCIIATTLQVKSTLYVQRRFI